MAPGNSASGRGGAGGRVYLQTRDALDGQITPASTLEDVPGIDGGVVHPMTGPVYVKGAKPGDLLEIEIIDIVPGTFGFTGILPHFGFLSDLFTDPFLVKWSMDGKHAVSEQLPGVRIPEASFMGTIGVAPSRAAMEEWREREARAAKAGDSRSRRTRRERCRRGSRWHRRG